MAEAIGKFYWFSLRNKRVEKMLTIVKEIEKTLDQGSCATYIQQLKGELAQCHVEFGDAQSETGFLSIVVLIEASLTVRPWKEYTPVHINSIRDALKVAAKESHITYEVYQKVRKAFRKKKIQTIPTIDLESLDTEGWEDDEEE